MIKRAFFLILFILLAYHLLNAQNGEFEHWNEQHLRLQKTGMVILGSWAFTNFAVSGYQMSKTSGNTYYFHQMNVFWNTVNVAIAASGYLSAINAETSLSQQETLMELNSFSKILLLNTGLDLAYMSAGLYLRERSRNIAKHSQRFKGYGKSLLLQGGFLFLFDLLLVIKNEHLTRQFLSHTNVNLSFTPGAFSVVLNF